MKISVSSQAVPSPSTKRVPEFMTTAVVTMLTVTPPTEMVSLHKFIYLDAFLSVTTYSCLGWVSLVYSSSLAASTELASFPGSHA